ncbi:MULTISPECIES: hypothetical protein [Streptomyces]|uniref:Secreted protein n=1 Tax=Streptomyces botrytidirepellens TaxID=2486417 RepID=A0A3M8T8J2_9ACTN|nr:MULTISPECIES: hypothetical protein [Streptomyces]QLH23555.1 hypothetical protein HYQ63_25445 [Streptomyces sp. Rer75]RNF87844.1 hypothetical protein EEJ42_41740 [Streptomyces botrytidirepellens]
MTYSKKALVSFAFAAAIAAGTAVPALADAHPDRAGITTQDAHPDSPQPISGANQAEGTDG